MAQVYDVELHIGAKEAFSQLCGSGKGKKEDF